MTNYGIELSLPLAVYWDLGHFYNVLYLVVSLGVKSLYIEVTLHPVSCHLSRHHRSIASAGHLCLSLLYPTHSLLSQCSPTPTLFLSALCSMPCATITSSTMFGMRVSTPHWDRFNTDIAQIDPVLWPKLNQLLAVNINNFLNFSKYLIFF